MINRFITTIILSLAVIIIPSQLLAEEKHKKLTIIGSVNNHPFSFYLPSNKPSGLYVEFWELWSETNDIPIDIKLTRFDETLNQTKNGKTVHMGLFQSASRQNWANFSLPIHRVETGALYKTEYNKDTKLSNLSDEKICIVEESYQLKFIRDNYPQFQIETTKDTDECIQLLADNSVDLFIGEIPAITAALSKLYLTGVFTLAEEVLFTNTVHATLAKGDPELVTLINNGIENIPIDKIIELEEKWLPTIEPFYKEFDFPNFLTIAEQKWLQKNNSFSLGIDINYQPYEYIDKNGNYSGVASDYIQHIESVLKVKMTPAINHTWLEALDLYKEGKIDILPAIVPTQERLKTINFTDSYIDLPIVIATRTNTISPQSIAELEGLNLGVITGYSLEASIRRDHPDVKIVNVSSIKEGLEELQKGKIDAYAGSLAGINNEIASHRMNDIYVASFAEYQQAIAMAVSDEYLPLIPIINKVLGAMPTKDKAEIANRWLAVQVQQGTPLETILIWLLPALIFTSVFIFFILRINNKLKNEIIHREKTENEHKALEKQLYQSQKMEALGSLAGGIAHDFNNMLAIIDGNAQLYKSRLSEDDLGNKYLNAILGATGRSTELVKQILTFGRKDRSPLTQINLSEEVIKSLQLLKLTTPKRIHIEENFQAKNAYIMGNASQINQIIVNLMTNSIASIENIGFIKVKIENYLDEQSKPFIKLSVTDNGIGISPDVKDKIFDPFFTTKMVGKGTGLGLSIVHSVVDNHHATIQLNSEQNIGTTVEIYFPAVNKGSIDINKHEIHKEVVKNTVDPFRKYSILVVDDEPNILVATEENLVAQGFKVDVCLGGKKAIELICSNVGSFDLVLTDFDMPDLTGLELGKVLYEVRPDLPLIINTGYNKISAEEVKNHPNIIAIVNKPVNFNGLKNTIIKTLNR